MSKKVKIRRKLVFIEEANNDEEAREYFGMGFRPIGPYFKVTGRVPASGLTRKEMEILLPEKLGHWVYPDSAAQEKHTFHKEVNKFYNSFMTRVPAEGLELEIGLLDDSKEISAENMPINLDDFLSYRHLREHPDVASDIMDCERNPLKKFYIEDNNAIIKAKAELNKIEDKANAFYNMHVKDEIKTIQILTLLNVPEPEKLEYDELVIRLKSYARTNDNRTDLENLARLKRFIEVCEDTHLQTKYDIEELVNTGILSRVGTSVLIAETNDVIGDDLNEAAVWFQSKKNSKAVNALKARYRDFAKTGVKMNAFAGGDYAPPKVEAEQDVEVETEKATQKSTTSENEEKVPNEKPEARTEGVPGTKKPGNAPDYS